MSSRPCYTIHELCDVTGVSVHQVHRWRLLGVLSPPHKPVSGRHTVWGRQHADEIRAIQRIREDNRTLLDIRDMLHPEDADV